jgi:aspartyl protease family protein
VPRDPRGHFEVDARVDGRRLNFMIDTGASVIALTADNAATLGIHPAEREYTVLVKTANGTVRAAPVELDRVEIEDITVRDVSAIVLPDGALSDNLLGMSFLSRLHRWEFADGKLVLEQ